MFTAPYALSPYIKQIHYVFKGLNMTGGVGGLAKIKEAWIPS
jgi:hypothetical protein